MKTKFLATLFLVIPIFTFSQINQSIDFVSGIDYSYRNLSTSSDEEVFAKIIDDRDEKEVGKLNWRIGFNYNLRITNNLFIKSGLRLSSVGHKGEKETGIKWASEFNGMEWTPDPNLPHEIQLIYDYWFTEIPIAGRFEINKKKLSPFIEMGVSPAIYMTTRIKEITDLDTNAEFSNKNDNIFNKIQVVGFLSFGMNYSINENYQIFGQPAFRYHFTKLAEGPINENLFNYGIEIGIRKKIK